MSLQEKKYRASEFLKKQRNKESKILLDKLQSKKKNATNILKCSKCIEKTLENETTSEKFRADDPHGTYGRYF